MPRTMPRPQVRGPSQGEGPFKVCNTATPLSRYAQQPTTRLANYHRAFTSNFSFFSLFSLPPLGPFFSCIFAVMWSEVHVSDHFAFISVELALFRLLALCKEHLISAIAQLIRSITVSPGCELPP